MRRFAVVLASGFLFATGCTSGESPPAPEPLTPAATAPPAASPTASRPLRIRSAAITEADVVRIESALKGPLPKAYRTFLLEHSGEVAALEKRSDEAGEFTVFPWSRADEIIKEHSYDLSFLYLEETNETLEDKVVLVATNGGGTTGSSTATSRSRGSGSSITRRRTSSRATTRSTTTCTELRQTGGGALPIPRDLPQ